ncbi:MAG TPA: DUF6514 family protein [Oscillospiraceae bacterium]|nr:DUF6514 family protein [Oscillospiraceae bacterium]
MLKSWNEAESYAAGLNEKYGKTSYEMIESVCRTDGLEGQTVYGIRAERPGTHLQRVQIEDVSPNKSRVMQLISKLERGQAEPEQLIYIVEDFLVDSN